MGVLHSVEHLHEEPDTGAQIQPLRVAVGREVAALDELQRQPRTALRIEPGVVEPCDVRMLEPGEDVALAGHARGEVLRPGETRQLEGDLALQRAVGTLREPHRAHAALADRPQQAVRSDLSALDEPTGTGRTAGRRAGGIGRTQVGDAREHRQVVHEIFGLDLGLQREQLAQRIGEPVVGRRQRTDEGLARRGRQVHDLVDQPAEPRPVGFDVGERPGFDRHAHQPSRPYSAPFTSTPARAARAPCPNRGAPCGR